VPGTNRAPEASRQLQGEEAAFREARRHKCRLDSEQGEQEAAHSMQVASFGALLESTAKPTHTAICINASHIIYGLCTQ